MEGTRQYNPNSSDHRRRISIIVDSAGLNFVSNHLPQYIPTIENRVRSYLSSDTNNRNRQPPSQ